MSSGIPPGSGPSGPPRLLDRVRQAIRARHYSLRTEEAYVGWIRRYILFHNKRHPMEMGENEINAFVTHLAVGGPVSASTQTQALSALMFLYRHVLRKPLPALETVIRAKRPGRLPTVLTRAEVRRILGRLNDTPRLVSTLLYGTGMRLLECLRLRVKDVEFGNNRIVVRDTKGGEDRVVPFPLVARAEMPSWLSRVKRIHERDLAEGFGTVYLPDAIARKFPGAEREWGWQYVFPGEHRSHDPRGGERKLARRLPAPRTPAGQPERRHHLHETVIQRASPRRSRRRYLPADQLSHLPPLFRHAPARRGVRYPDDSGAPRAQGRENHDDLHPRLEPWRTRCTQSCRHPVGRSPRRSGR